MDKLSSSKDEGKRAEAKAALEAFLASVTPTDDTRGWGETFLKDGDPGHRIRHEIYERFIFPIWGNPSLLQPAAK